jgi:cytochrome d ubiquinol oxidase subunit I
MDDLVFARAQMATSLAFHIVFAVVGIGMPLLMVLAEWWWLRTGDGVYLELAKRWAKGTAILFAVGAVSGTVLSFELGLLWPAFMAHAGAIIGMPFSLEGFAFFTEAIFLGIYLYAWRLIPPRTHLLAGVVVALSGALSGIFVVSANAWMNAPTGFRLVDGAFTDIDPIAALFNAAMPTQVLHMTLAAYAATGFGVAGIHAWALRRGTPHAAFHRGALRVALWVALPAALLQPLSGDLSARDVATRQPVKLAAMEGHLRTGPAPFVVGGWPDERTLTHRGALEIPGALSFLLTGNPDTVLPGVDAVPPADRPPLGIVHAAFQLMVACGSAMALVALWGGWRAWRRRRGGGVPLPADRPFLLALVLTGPLGFVAVEAGWTVTEVGRQPWIIHGVMRTAEAVTPVPGVGVSFALFTLLYLGLAVTVTFLLWRQILKTGVTPAPLGLTGEFPLPPGAATGPGAPPTPGVP